MTIRNLPHSPIVRRRPDIICFSIIDWSFRYQRPQQLMSQFAAQGHRVFYINLNQFLSVTAEPRFVARLIKENIYGVTLAAERPPEVYREIIRGTNRESILESLDALREAFQIEEALGYMMQVSWGEVAFEARQRWGWQVIYDCMDHWENFPGVSSALVEMEPRVVQDCDLLIVSGQRLYEKWSNYQRPTVLVRNAVDYPAYSARLQPNALLHDIQPPLIGYFGAIAEWFDVEWLVHAATERARDRGG